MKNLKFYFLFLSLGLILSMLSCVNNDDKGSGDGSGDDGGKEVTKDNIEQGEWEIAYTTVRRKVTLDGGPDVTARIYSMDGFSVEFLEGSKYLERNSLGEETIINGKYRLDESKKSIELNYEFKNYDTGLVEDSISEIKVYRLTDKVMVYYLEKEDKTNNLFMQTVFYLRNKKNGPDEFLVSDDLIKNNEKKGRLDPSKIKGTWVLTNVSVASRTTSNPTWTTDEEDHRVAVEERQKIGVKYSYNTDVYPFVYEQFGLSGSEPVQKGNFTITDDVVHYYYDYEDGEGNVKPVMVSMAIGMENNKKFIYTSSKYTYGLNKVKIQRIYTTFEKVE